MEVTAHTYTCKHTFILCAHTHYHQDDRYHHFFVNVNATQYSRYLVISENKVNQILDLGLLIL